MGNSQLVDASLITATACSSVFQIVAHRATNDALPRRGGDLNQPQLSQPLQGGDPVEPARLSGTWGSRAGAEGRRAAGEAISSGVDLRPSVRLRWGGGERANTSRTIAGLLGPELVQRLSECSGASRAAQVVLRGPRRGRVAPDGPAPHVAEGMMKNVFSHDVRRRAVVAVREPPRARKVDRSLVLRERARQSPATAARELVEHGDTGASRRAASPPASRLSPRAARSVISVNRSTIDASAAAHAPVRTPSGSRDRFRRQPEPELRTASRASIAPRR